MSDGYGSCKWTCGECGESYEASGVVGDFKVDRWARDHRERHRVEKLSPEARTAYAHEQIKAMGRMTAFGLADASDPAPLGETEQS